MRSFSIRSGVILLLLIVTPGAWACINLYYTDLEGHSHQGGRGEFGLFHAKVDIPRWQELHDKLEQELQAEDDFKKHSDFAATLMHLGKLEQAIEILVELEATHPGEYTIAGNLGTAYELAGDFDNAIHWIKVGMERNPKSHHGTEWLHVRILEAKQELANDPNWLQTHSVLGLDFGTNEKPELLRLGDDGGNLEKNIFAIDHQLSERLQFVEAPNPIVADLLITLGNLVALDGSVETAIKAYRLAMEFEPQSDPELIQSRLSHFKELVKANPKSGSSSHEELNALPRKWSSIVRFCAIGFGIAILVASLWWMRRRRAKRLLG